MRLLFLLASVVLVIVAPAALSDDGYFSCPDGWFGPHGYKCYKLVSLDDEKLLKAVNRCAIVGASAASIHSKEENTYLSEQLQAAATKGAWIGLFEWFFRSTGKWLDGSALTFDNFGTSPRMNDTNECVLLLPDGQWRAAPCWSHPWTFLCQWTPGLETALPRIDAKINALERQLNETCDHRTADLQAQTKFLKGILLALVVTICVLVLLVVLVFAFRSFKGAVMTWWRRRDGTDRMNLIEDA